jgi:cytoskeletal protein CcmA (bactofilin family)
VKNKKEDQIKAYMGEETVFKGSLNFEGTVRIDGKYEGQVFTDDTLIIGKTGQVIAEISAGTIICMGRIEGTLLASKRVEIHANSRVIGNIKSPALYIELGGILDGTCDMTTKETKVNPLVKIDEKEKKVSSQSTKG